MKSTIGAVLVIGAILMVPLAISLTAAATSEKTAFRVNVETPTPMRPEPHDDYDEYE